MVSSTAVQVVVTPITGSPSTRLRISTGCSTNRVTELVVKSLVPGSEAGSYGAVP